MGAKKASVIIPSYNSWRTLTSTLASLRNQTRRDAIAEILVVDSSDDEKTRSRLREARIPELRVLESRNRLIPAVARNVGAALAEGDLLVFVDSDVALAADWLETVLAQAQAGRRIGGGAICLPEFQKSRWIPAAQFFLQFNEYMDLGSPRPVAFLPSCNLFCERSLFQRVGGFPELRAAEDVLFCLKAGREEKIWFIPQARVDHIFRERWTDMARNQRLLGKYVFLYRRLVQKEKFYYRNLWPLLFLPGFLAVKSTRIARRLVRSRAELVSQFLGCFPVFLLGLFFWGVGFVEGIFTEREPAPRGVEAWSS